MKIAFFEVDGQLQHLCKAAFPDDTLLFFDEPLNDEVPASVQDADILSIFICSRISPDILKQFNRLKLIATRSTGCDHIAIKEAYKRGIQVCNVPHYARIAVAEYTVALLLALSRKLYQAYNQVCTDQRFSCAHLQGFDLYDKTLGVIGTGDIGKTVIKLIQGFGMKIVAYDIHPDDSFAQQYNVTYKDFSVVLNESDIVTLHVPLNQHTRHLINKETISSFKHGSYLINTARGDIVETEALVVALKKHILAGAALDVLQDEWYFQDPLSFLQQTISKEVYQNILLNQWLIRDDRVIVTPHNAFNTRESVMRLNDVTIENIKSWLNGDPLNIINPNEVR